MGQGERFEIPDEMTLPEFVYRLAWDNITPAGLVTDGFDAMPETAQEKVVSDLYDEHQQSEEYLNEILPKVMACAEYVGDDDNHNPDILHIYDLGLEDRLWGRGYGESVAEEYEVADSPTGTLSD